MSVVSAPYNSIIVQCNVRPWRVNATQYSRIDRHSVINDDKLCVIYFINFFALQWLAIFLCLVFTVQIHVLKTEGRND